MKKGALWYGVILLQYNVCTGYSFSIGDITNFTQSSPAIALHENMTFECEGTLIGMYPFNWKINGVNLYEISDQRDIYEGERISRDDGYKYINVKIQANETNNNTIVTCLLGPSKKTKTLIIASMFTCIHYSIS